MTLRDEVKRLRAALRGIASCSTCEVCRGAAMAALDPPQAATPTQFPASFLDGSHDPERADCACDRCEEGRAPTARVARVVSGTGDSGERLELAALVRGLRAND